jgi:acyl-CoA synthetase (NDP forming)/GNAT superfamily N-acetyltransferase
VTTSRDDWATSVVLADGESAYLRPMDTADAAALLEFHERQPRENLYRRFFSPKPTLTAAELTHFTEVDFVDRVALVLEIRGEFAAWASYERWPGRRDADVAFLVDDSHQGKGIATLLLEHLAAIARTNGIERFTADVLADNRPMLSVFAKAGWPIRRHFDSGIMDLEFALDDTANFVDSVEVREQRADSRSVARLLLPRSIAVIGASDRVGSVGHELWRNVVSGFDLPVFAVNPNHNTVGGVPAYATVAEIVDDIWLAVIACPVASLVEVIDQCIERRVRGAVIITAVDGSGVDMIAIVDRARRHGMRIIGAASMGIATGRAPGVSGVQAALVPVDVPAGHIAISMQSGSLGASLLQLAQRMDMGLSWFVSLGDKSDVSGNDLLQFWEDDDATSVIAMYTETFGNPRKFARIARRVGRRRPIVTIRTGAAGLGAATAALYEQTGLVEVPTVRSMLDTARVFASQPMLTGPRVAIISNSRSPGVLARTALINAGLTVVEPPISLDWRATTDEFDPAVRAAIASDEIDALLVIHAPPIMSADAPAMAIDAAATGSTKPVVAVMLGRDDGPIQPGSCVPAFSFPEPASAVLGRMWRYRKWLDSEAAAPIPNSEDLGVEPLIVTDIIHSVLERDDRMPSLDEAHTMLRAYGLSVPEATRLEQPTADSVARAATALGYPVAMKSTRRRAGRSVEAGVALDLTDERSVIEALTSMRASLGADADVVVIQSMVSPGVDVRIRCGTDDRLGPVLTFGLGGVTADAIGDETSRLVPVSAAAATNLIEGSRAGIALRSAHISIDALVETVVRVGQLMADHPEIGSLDINPAIVSARGCQIADVEMTLSAENHPDAALRRLV